ncbi:MAG: hypothetical protein ACXVP5_12840 [Tumebacillaceae bacterium]
MNDINVAGIALNGQPEKKEYEASPFLPARTGWLIPFTYEDVEYKFHVIEINGDFDPIAVYRADDQNTVIPKFVFSQSKRAISNKLLQDANLL